MSIRKTDRHFFLFRIYTLSILEIIPEECQTSAISFNLACLSFAKIMINNLNIATLKEYKEKQKLYVIC